MKATATFPTQHVTGLVDLRPPGRPAAVLDVVESRSGAGTRHLAGPSSRPTSAPASEVRRRASDFVAGRLSQS